MKSIALSLSVLVAAYTADVAFSMESSPTQGVARATGAPADVPLRAAVPMIYKTYGTAGARSSWDAQRSSTVVLQNVGSDAAVGTICFYASVADGTPVSAQTFGQCYSLPAIRPGASYPVELDTLAEIGGGFRGSALIYSLGEVSAIGAHKFADTSNFLAISTADAITPDAAGGRTYVPTFYADFDGALSTHAMSALFAQLVIQQSNMAMMLMGKVAHPQTGQVHKDIESARLFIDQLEMLEAKTKGNLSKEESALLKHSLMTLRLAFVDAVEPGKPLEAPSTGASSSQPEQQSENTNPASPADEEHRKKFSKKY